MEEQEKYRVISEIYATEQAQSFKIASDLLAARQALIQMEIDVLEFAKSKGVTAKVSESLKKIGLIDQAFNHFSKIDSDNNTFRLMLRQAIAEKDYYRNQAEELQKQIEATNKALNAA